MLQFDKDNEVIGFWDPILCDALKAIVDIRHRLAANIEDCSLDLILGENKYQLSEDEIDEIANKVLQAPPGAVVFPVIQPAELVDVEEPSSNPRAERDTDRALKEEINRLVMSPSEDEIIEEDVAREARLAGADTPAVLGPGKE